MTTSAKVIVITSITVAILSVTSIIVLNRSLKPVTTSGSDRPDDSIRIAVFNGCGRSGLAGMYAEKIRELGFDVVNGMGENADSFDFDISVVVVRKGKDRKKAEAVAHALSIDSIILQNTDDPYIIEDVAVIIGRDWYALEHGKEDNTD